MWPHKRRFVAKSLHKRKFAVKNDPFCDTSFSYGATCKKRRVADFKLHTKGVRGAWTGHGAVYGRASWSEELVQFFEREHENLRHPDDARLALTGVSCMWPHN